MSHSSFFQKSSDTHEEEEQVASIKVLNSIRISLLKEIQEAEAENSKQNIATQNIGFIHQLGNLILRRIKPRYSEPVIHGYHHKIPTPEQVEKSDNIEIKYPLYEVILQPTANSCGDAAAMMILKFHRQHLEAEIKYLIKIKTDFKNESKFLNPKNNSEKIAAFITRNNVIKVQIDYLEKTLDYISNRRKMHPSQDFLNQVQFKKISEPYRTQKEIEKLYCLNELPLQSTSASVNEFSKELCQHLYERGPLGICISNNRGVTHHQVTLIGIFNETIKNITELHALIADPWQGRLLSIPMQKLAKIFADEANSVLCLAVPGYSFSLLHEIERKLSLAQYLPGAEPIRPKAAEDSSLITVSREFKL